MVIKNENDWNNLKSKIDFVNNETESFFEGDLDFNKHTIIAIFRDIKSSCWEVSISKILENTAKIIVSIDDNSLDCLAYNPTFPYCKNI